MPEYPQLPLTLLQAAVEVHTIAQFKHWVRNQVRNVLPHGALACGHGRVHAAGVAMDYVITVDYPIEHLAAIRNTAGGIDTPIMRRWMRERIPLLFDAAHPWPEVAPEWLAKFNQHALVNAAAHAEFDETRCVGTYYSFHRLPQLGEAQRTALAELTPVLHETLLRVIANLEAEPTADGPSLTARETEIMQWVGLGKSNQDIASLLGLSENTVKHHVSNILQKSKLENRVQLVAWVVAREARSKAAGTRVL